MSDRDGVVSASVPGLARRAGVTIEQCQLALDIFLSPDPYSRTPDHEGRRIAKVDGGWELLNHERYHGPLSPAERKRRSRHRRSANVQRASDGEPTRHRPDVSDRQIVTYFAQTGGPDGPVKIGKASNPWSRVKELSTGCPDEIRLIAIVPGDCEAELHARFSMHRIRGEWFEFAGQLRELASRHMVRQ